ncbi:MAG: trehalose-6-phosphate synthase, partial [Desulfohalobium sp.]
RDGVDEADRVAVPPENPKYTLKRVWLSDEQVDGYYYGFSNSVLWPLCHSSLSAIRVEDSYWEQYHRTNKQFADNIAEEAGESPIVWLQDYHLALVPWLVVGGGRKHPGELAQVRMQDVLAAVSRYRRLSLAAAAKKGD